MNFDNDLLFTGGRDGTIFRTTMSEQPSEQPYEKVLEGDGKNMITSL